MATVMRYFCLHFTSVQLSRYVCSYTLFFSKDVVFPAQAEYSYFSAHFRLKIFLYYSYIIAYGIFVLFRIYWAINYKCLVSGSGSCSVHCACALDTTFRSGGQDVTSKYTLYIYTSNSSHYICPRVGYDVFYAMNCTILISKYVFFFACRLLN